MTPWEAFNRVDKVVWHVKVSIKIRKRRLLSAHPEDEGCHIGPVDPLTDGDKRCEKVTSSEVFKSKLDAYKFIVHKLGTHIKNLRSKINARDSST